jgi:hypothetical protein
MVMLKTGKIMCIDPGVDAFSPNPYVRLISIDAENGSYEIVILHGGESRLTIEPLRGDVDGDTDTDLLDFDWLISRIDGPQDVMSCACDLAGMGADGDVDLFEVPYFMLGHTAFQDSGQNGSRERTCANLARLVWVRFVFFLHAMRRESAFTR